MGLLDSLLAAAAGNTQQGEGDGNNQLMDMVHGLINQNGGLEGLANKFSQSGHGDAFSSWVGTGENQPVSSNVIQQVLGSEQIRGLAAKMGLDPAQVAGFIAQYLPMIINMLTPQGKIDPNADHPQGLAAMLPSILQSLGGGRSE